MKKLVPWFLLAVYLALLFGTLSIAPSLWMNINAKTHGALANLLPILGISGFCTLYGMLIKRRGRKALREIVFLSLIVISYGFLFSFVTMVPLEQFHLVEYGILSLLVYLALHPYGTFNHVARWSFVITIAVGIADEVCQWYLPERFFDLRDIMINALSSLLALALIGLLVLPQPGDTAGSHTN